MRLIERETHLWSDNNKDKYQARHTCISSIVKPQSKSWVNRNISILHYNFEKVEKKNECGKGGEVLNNYKLTFRNKM